MNVSGNIRLNRVTILFEHICCSLEELMELAWFKDTWSCSLSGPRRNLIKKTEEMKQTKVKNSLPKILPGKEAAAKQILKNREVNILQ